MTWSTGHSRNSEEYEVFRNGEREPLAVRANTTLGWVERYRTDVHGQILRSTATGRAITEQVYGDVELFRN